MMRLIIAEDWVAGSRLEKCAMWTRCKGGGRVGGREIDSIVNEGLEAKVWRRGEGGSSEEVKQKLRVRRIEGAGFREMRFFWKKGGAGEAAGELTIQGPAHTPPLDALTISELPNGNKAFEHITSRSHETPTEASRTTAEIVHAEPCTQQSALPLS